MKYLLDLADHMLFHVGGYNFGAQVTELGRQELQTTFASQFVASQNLDKQSGQRFLGVQL